MVEGPRNAQLLLLTDGCCMRVHTAQAQIRFNDLLDSARFPRNTTRYSTEHPALRIFTWNLQGTHYLERTTSLYHCPGSMIKWHLFAELDLKLSVCKLDERRVSGVAIQAMT